MMISSLCFLFSRSRVRAALIGTAVGAAILLNPLPVLAQTAAPTLQNPSPAPAEKRFNITEGLTPGGFRLVHFLIPDEKDQILSLFWPDRETQHNPAKAALMTLAPTMMAIGGAGPLDSGALDEELKDLGGSFSFNRGRAFAYADVFAPKEQFEEVLRLFGTALFTPRLADITLTRRKRFMVNGMKASRDKAENMAAELLQRIVIGAHPIISGVTLEPPSTIADVSKSDIEDWRKSVLVRQGLTIVAAGPLSRDAVADLVDRTLQALPDKGRALPSIPLQPQSLAKTIVIERKVEQSIILMGGPLLWRMGGPEGTARNMAMSVLGGSSSSRLFVAVREKLGAAYGASASIANILDDQALLAMQASVANDKVAQALAAMQQEYQKFRENGVTAEEIDPLKRRMANGFPEAMRKSGGAANSIRTGLINDLGFNAANNVEIWINGQTPAAINALIKARLPEKLTTILVVPSIRDLEAKGIKPDCVLANLDELPKCVGP